MLKSWMSYAHHSPSTYHHQLIVITFYRKNIKKNTLHVRCAEPGSTPTQSQEINSKPYVHVYLTLLTMPYIPFPNSLTSTFLLGWLMQLSFIAIKEAYMGLHLYKY